MLDMSMIWEKIKEKVKCTTCNRHWYIIAAVESARLGYRPKQGPATCKRCAGAIDTRLAHSRILSLQSSSD